ncbi:hypothetical protein Q1695_008033 [Nippostrongylus brasiliensis]|nr:hypothetical protein Q1695_008033 [Nippostrongylus brasiliensis]
MTSSGSNREDRQEPAGDYWIFEQLGSPLKQPNQQALPKSENGSQNDQPVPSKSIDGSRGMDRNKLEQKLRIYANNMRKLIITARKQIKDLKQENTTLKHKLESSGLIECPACLFRFKPEKKHRVFPKYVKVFRGKLALEMEFQSLDDLTKWLTVNQLDEGPDGVPTMADCRVQKLDLTSTGSVLHDLVKEEEKKRERIVISTRPRAVPTGSSNSLGKSCTTIKKEVQEKVDLRRSWQSLASQERSDKPSISSRLPESPNCSGSNFPYREIGKRENNSSIDLQKPSPSHNMIKDETDRPHCAADDLKKQEHPMKVNRSEHPREYTHGRRSHERENDRGADKGRFKPPPSHHRSPEDLESKAKYLKRMVCGEIRNRASQGQDDPLASKAERGGNERNQKEEKRLAAKKRERNDRTEEIHRNPRGPTDVKESTDSHRSGRNENRTEDSSRTDQSSTRKRPYRDSPRHDVHEGNGCSRERQGEEATRSVRTIDKSPKRLRADECPRRSSTRDHRREIESDKKHRTPTKHIEEQGTKDRPRVDEKREERSKTTTEERDRRDSSRTREIQHRNEPREVQRRRPRSARSPSSTKIRAKEEDRDTIVFGDDMMVLDETELEDGELSD